MAKAESDMKNHWRTPKWKPKSTQNDLLTSVAKKHKVSVEEMLGKSRTKKFLMARAEACYLMRTRFGYSFPMIARVLGQYRAHTTALYMVGYHALLVGDDDQGEDFTPQKNYVLRRRVLAREGVHRRT